MGNSTSSPTPSSPLKSKDVDYDDDKNWGWLPGRCEDTSSLGFQRYDPNSVYATHARDMTTNTVTPITNGRNGPIEDTHVDVFFVHPTTNLMNIRKRNATMEGEQSDLIVRYCIKNQGSAFATAGDVYAPFYRAGSFINYATPGDKSEQAFTIALGDVCAAFESFLRRIEAKGPGRDFILAGHSQGSQNLIRMLKKKFDVDTPEAAALRSRLVCAYLIGYQVGPDTFSNGLIRVARTPTDTGGVYVSWCTVAKGTSKAIVSFHRSSYKSRREADWVSLTSRPTCTNPLSWANNDNVLVGPDKHIGRFNLDSESKSMSIRAKPLQRFKAVVHAVTASFFRKSGKNSDDKKATAQETEDTAAAASSSSSSAAAASSASAPAAAAAEASSSSSSGSAAAAPTVTAEPEATATATTTTATATTTAPSLPASADDSNQSTTTTPLATTTPSPAAATMTPPLPPPASSPSAPTAATTDALTHGEANHNEEVVREANHNADQVDGKIATAGDETVTTAGDEMKEEDDPEAQEMKESEDGKDANNNEDNSDNKKNKKKKDQESKLLLLTHSISARANDETGLLEVTDQSGSTKPLFIYGPTGDLHAVDILFFWANIRENCRARVQAWRQKRTEAEPGTPNSTTGTSTAPTSNTANSTIPTNTTTPTPTAATASTTIPAAAATATATTTNTTTTPITTTATPITTTATITTPTTDADAATVVKTDEGGD